MNIVIPINLVPDLVEELEIDETGKQLDTTWLRMVINEFDDHAIEQGILLKERAGGTVTILAPAVEEIEDVLFNASARGADRLIRVGFDSETHMSPIALANLFAQVAKDLNPDLILTGVQAHNDLEGQIGPLLAEILGLPYVGYVAGVAVDGQEVLARKEFPGGLIAEMALPLPAVLGIQAADEPPRYVAFSKVRQAMGSAEIEDISGELTLDWSSLPIKQMTIPEAGDRAELLEGSPEEVATQIIKIFNAAAVR